MKILLLANKLPYPPKDGGSIATLNMARSFAELGHEVIVLAMNTSKHYFDPEQIPADLKKSIMFLAANVNTDIRLHKALINLLISKKPYNAERFISRAYENLLVEILDKQHFDIIQLEGLYLAPYLPIIKKSSKALVVMRAHNIEYEIWIRTARQNYGLKKWYLLNLAKRIRKMELSYLNSYDLMVPITRRDAGEFVKLGCNLPIHVAPSGIFIEEIKTDRSAIEFPSLFHIGALDWGPNQEGLFWFLKNVWEKMNINHPGLKFFIAGRNAPEKIRQIDLPNVFFLGEVEDAYAFMNRKAIMVVPLLSGSGLRIKIIEGMALGKTIVSTSIGAEGINCINGKHILIADTPEKFIEEIENLLDNFDKFDAIGKQAALFVRNDFNNLVITSALLDFYNKYL